MDFERVDMREMTEEEMTKAGEMAEIVFKLNHTSQTPMSTTVF